MFYALMLLGSVIFLDLMLSGDNAVVIAMAANTLGAGVRERAIIFGMTLAAILRIIFAIFALTLLRWHIIAFLGGFLLLLIDYQLVKSLLAKGKEATGVITAGSFWQAIGIITAADVSMSLDNVLSVAALARNYMVIMVIGIAISIGMLTVISKYIADFLAKYHWLNWIGVALIAWVAFDLIVGNYNSTLALIRQ